MGELASLTSPDNYYEDLDKEKTLVKSHLSSSISL